MRSQTLSSRSEAVSTSRTVKPSSKQSKDKIRSALDELLEFVSDEEGFDLRQAAELARQACLADHSFESSIVLAAKSPGLSPNEVIRLIRILEVICSKPKLLSNLLGLKATDPRVRSKVTLTVGRLVQNAAWLREQLSDPDPRVRADAVEALWTAQVDGIESLLTVAVRDPNNRVASNAACALHKLGVADSIPTLTGLLNHPDPKFRCSGVWAISHVGDPRFLPKLRDDGGFHLDTEESELRNAAIEQLEERLEQGRLSDTIALKVHSVSAYSRRGRTLRCSCIPSDPTVPLTGEDLRAVNFELIENEESIDSYSFRWAADLPELTSILLLPHGLDLRDHVLAKHPSLKVEETLSISRYRSGAQKPKKESPSTTRIRQVIQSIPPFAQALANSLETLKSASGHCHLFVVADNRLLLTLSAPLRKAIRTANVTVHAVVAEGISEPTLAALTELCSETGGNLVKSCQGRAVVQLMHRVRAEHGSIVEITWESRSDKSKALQVKCFSSIGYGETTLSSDTTPINAT